MDKVVAALGILVGGLGAIFALLTAFGVHLSQDQMTAIASVASLALVILGVWFHPAVAAKRNAAK